MKKLKEQLERALSLQKIAVDSAESDEEKQYALGWLHSLESVIDLIK